MAGNQRSNYQTSRLFDYPTLAVLLLLAAVTVSLAAGLRPDAFFVGDPGIKLIAAENALAHPLRPFDISLPTIGADSFPHVERFFAVHGTHAHAVTSPVFPVLTAPFLATFGLRGVYILPGLAFLVLVVAMAAVAQALDRRRDPLVVGVAAALGTPFLFYGLEFWEHAPALALGAVGLALFLRGRAFASGLFFGAAALLRPEGVYFAVSAVVLSRILPDPPGYRSWLQAGAGALLVMAPYEVYILVHTGVGIPPHLSANAGLVGGDWLAARWALARIWFLSGSDASFWRVAPVVAIAAASLVAGSNRSGRAFLWSMAIANIVLVWLTAPNDGGGQWGPRYLLFAYMPLVVLAADGIAALPMKSVAAVAVLVLMVAGCAWIQRSAYRQLRGTKITYGRIVDFVASVSPAGGYVVTDVWWLDQVAAVDTSTRHFLFAPDGEIGRSIVKRLSDLTVPMVTVVRSSSESADTSSWAAGCYFEEERATISTRGLVAIRLRHRCSER